MMMRFLTAFVFMTALEPSYALGLRNFRDLKGFFSDVTEVPSTNSNVNIIYNQTQSSLPQSSDLLGFTGVAVRSASALAGIYCMEFVLRESKKNAPTRKAHNGVDFNLVPAMQTQEVQDQVVQNYANLFWARPATAAELNIFKSISSRLVPKLQANARGTQQLYSALCSMAGTSVESLVIVD